MSRTIILIQGRMNSQRLPGKTMMNIGHSVVLEHLLLSLDQISSINEIAVLTSVLEDNDKIREFCFKNGVTVYSGDEKNVASRFYGFLKNKKCDYFVRLSADSPLFDYRILKDALHLINNNNFDIYSTIYSRRFPSGMNFEILRRELFLNEYKNFNLPEHFEHVTKYFYDNSEKFKIKQIDIPQLPTSREYKFSLDTIKDKDKLLKIFDSLNKDHFYYNLYEKCLIYDKVVRNNKC